VVFDIWTQDGSSFCALFAKRLALFFVVCTIHVEAGQTGRWESKQSTCEKGRGTKMEERRKRWGRTFFVSQNDSCENYYHYIHVYIRTECMGPTTARVHTYTQNQGRFDIAIWKYGKG